MIRALAIFSVSHGALRLRVRLLPSVRDVNRSFRAGGKSLCGGVIHAYAQPARRSDARHQVTLVLPADGRLAELVPHEVVHAVLYYMGHPNLEWFDESVPTAIGLLTARILARLRSLGVEVT